MADDVNISVAIDSHGARSGARRVNSALQQIHHRAGSLKDRIFSLQGALGGLAIGSTVYKTLNEFASLDQGLIGVQKTTNATDQEIKQIRQDIQDMALDIPVATDRLLEIAQAAGQLGVTGTENIRVFTDTIARLETASDLAGDQAATSLARLINVTGGSIENVDRLGSVIVALGNNMAATESEITKLATEVGQATSVFSVSAEQATALGAAMRSMGVRAELGGSVVGRAMREIDAAIRSGGESMEYLQQITGMTGQELRKTFEQDATRVFQAWVEGIGRMTSRGQSAAAILERFNLSGQEVLKVLPAMANNSELLAQALNIQAKETKNATALTKESIKAASSFSSQMRLTWNAVDEIAASVGEGLAPAIVDLTQDFRAWVEVNEDFIQQDIPEAMKEFGGAVTSVVSGMIELASNTRKAWIASKALLGLDPTAAKTLWDEYWESQKEGAEAATKAYREFNEATKGEGLWERFARLARENGHEAGKDFAERFQQGIEDVPIGVGKALEAVPYKRGPQKPAGQPDIISPEYFDTIEGLEEQRKQLIMTEREWEKFYATAGKDFTSAQEQQINQMIDRIYDMRRAMEWDEKAGAPAGIGPAGVSGADDQWAKEQMEKADEIGNKWDETYNQMANAFDGWANSYSSTLNDMLWESELTFDKILQSFGRMVTEMLIQSAMSDVTGALFGKAGGGEGPGLLKKGVNKAAIWAMDAMYGFDKGGVLPSDVYGFDKQGRTYRMHAGETVQPTHKDKSAGQKVQYNNFKVIVQAREGKISKQSQRQLRRSLTKSVSAADRE